MQQDCDDHDEKESLAFQILRHLNYILVCLNSEPKCLQVLSVPLRSDMYNYKNSLTNQHFK